MRSDAFQNGNSQKGNGSGLRPSIAAACREALRDVASADAVAHVEGCSFCAARERARSAIGEWASVRPAIPAALKSSAMLEGIYERAAEAAEAGPVGEWLEQAPAITPDAVAGEAAADAAGRSVPSLQDCLDTDVARTELLRDFVGAPENAPKQPDSQVWNGVCRSILDGVASERVLQRQPRWRVLLVGAAAAAVIGLLSIQEDAPVQPTIAFVDMDRAPDVAFANARYGSRY